MKSILAIDPGQHCGYAYWGEMRLAKQEPWQWGLDHGVWNLKGDWPQRLNELNQRLTMFPRPDLVAIERIASGGPSRPNMQLLQRYIGIVMGAAYPTPVLEVPPQSWKAACGVKGKDYLKGIERLWSTRIPGITIASADEAAALGILFWAERRAGK